ncbi:MAG: very short patch repair endonuclease [Clostridiaceae bacterium]|nr:very short patch repair endonuclease [Clostridiaceae bacterium]
MDNLTKEQRHKNMKNIKSKDTKIERKLCKALWNKGYRYRKNYVKLPGKPDIALTKYKIAIFCDGEFFHGKDWNKQKVRLEKSNNSDYWINKISKNIERDSKVDRELFQLGWIVLRFWGKDILKNVDKCIDEIEETIYDLEIESLENNYDIDDSDNI